jgi:hypothetical protein
MIEQDREIQESPLYQGVDEEIKYKLKTTPWGSSPSSPSVVIKKLPSNEDVSSTCLNGSPSVSGDVITLPTVKSLSASTLYRLEVKFSVGGNVMEAWIKIVGQE